MQHRIQVNRSSVAVASLISLLLMALPADVYAADLFQPSGVRAGDVYHLIFTTRGRRDAASVELSDYQTFVSNEAALSDLTKAADWWPLVSVALPDDSSIDARSFIKIEGPIYNMNDELFSDSGLFSENRNVRFEPLTAPNYDQFGLEHNVAYAVATGTRTDGSGQDPLGGRIVSVASNVDWPPSKTWLVIDDEPEHQLYHYYAISQPIVAVPEPTATILGSGIWLTSIAIGLRRRLSLRVIHS